MLTLLMSAPISVVAMESDPVTKEITQLEQGPSSPASTAPLAVATPAPATPALVAAPAVAAPAAPSQEDHLAHLKSVFNVQTERAVANKLRNFVHGLEEVKEDDLIAALKKLGAQGKLVSVHQAVAQTRGLSLDGAEGSSANTALQAAISILSTAYSVVTDPANQQKIQAVVQGVQAEVQEAQNTGCWGICKKKQANVAAAPANK